MHSSLAFGPDARRSPRTLWSNAMRDHCRECGQISRAVESRIPGIAMYVAECLRQCTDGFIYYNNSPANP
jgi:hypothetical protein